MNQVIPFPKIYKTAHELANDLVYQSYKHHREDLKMPARLAAYINEDRAEELEALYQKEIKGA